MKHKKTGALFLSVAAAVAIAVPATVGAVYAAETIDRSFRGESGDLDLTALESYYENILASSAVRYGTVAGANTGGGACLWSESDINPDYGNVTVSYTYTTTAPKTGCYGFGFRFTLAGDRHVALVRMKNRMPVVQYDRDLSVGRVNAKFYADEYYSAVGGENAGDKLGSFVNTDEYTQIAVPTDVNDRNGYDILKGIPSVALGDTALKTVSVSVMLRKITDENGVVSYRYYENGDYFFTVQFEDEVVAYAPNAVNPTASHIQLSDFEVKLNDPYTEFDQMTDANAAHKKASLEVGETVEYSFRKQIDSTCHPTVCFSYGEDGGGVAVLRYAKRIHLNPMSKRQIKGGEKSIYVKSLHTWGDNNAVDLCRADGVYTITNIDGSWDIAQNYGVKDQWQYAELVYKVERLANETIEGTEYAMYIFSEGYDGAMYDYAKLGFPVADGVELYGYCWLTGTPDRIVTIKSAKLDDMKNDAALNPENPTTDGFSDKYAQTGGSSVRYAADSQGLRFSAAIGKDLVKAYASRYGENNVSFGVKLVRADDGAYAYIDAVNYTEREDVYTFNGVVTDIPASRYAVRYTPYVYVKYTGADNVSQYILTAAGEAKSISEVCAAALADVSAVKTDFYLYSVTIGGQTVYSPYTQSKIDVMQQYIVG